MIQKSVWYFVLYPQYLALENHGQYWQYLIWHIAHRVSKKGNIDPDSVLLFFFLDEDMCWEYILQSKRSFTTTGECYKWGNQD